MSHVLEAPSRGLGEESGKQTRKVSLTNLNSYQVLVVKRRPHWGAEPGPSVSPGPRQGPSGGWRQIEPSGADSCWAGGSSRWPNEGFGRIL